MNSVFTTLSYFLYRPPHRTLSCLHLRPVYTRHYQHSSISYRSSPSISYPLSLQSPCKPQSSISTSFSSKEGALSEVDSEDFIEKDWSFIDTDDLYLNQEHVQKIDRIISAGDIVETSKVVISNGSEAFADRVVDSSPCQELIVVHDSLFVLACIKEKHDKVKCWQGELINVPDMWAPFDVVFLYFLPALPFELDQVLEALREHCLPGSRIVISHPQGRKTLEEQRQQYPDVIVSGLPLRSTLQNVASDNSFEITDFSDDPDFYLAVLKFRPANLLEFDNVK